MHAIFSHGHLSSPASAKIRKLSPVVAALGFEVEAIDYSDLRDDPVARVERLKKRVEQLDDPPVLIGSSLGGLVSLAACEVHPVSALFLMAPALFMEDRIPGGEVREVYRPRCEQIAVVHGWGDDICPWQGSLEFARASRASLHLIDADHRLDEALPMIASVLRTFLESVLTRAPRPTRD